MLCITENALWLNFDKQDMLLHREGTSIPGKNIAVIKVNKTKVSDKQNA